MSNPSNFSKAASVIIGGKKFNCGDVKRAALRKEASQIHLERSQTVGTLLDNSIFYETRLESRATFLEAKAKYASFNEKGVTLGSGVKQISREAVSDIRKSLWKNDDVGAQTVNSLLGTAQMAPAVFKFYQNLPASAVNVTKASIAAPGAIYNAGKKTVDVVSTCGRASVTVVNTISLSIALNASGTPISKAMVGTLLRQQAIRTGLNSTMLSKNIVSATQRMQHGIATIKYKGLESSLRVLGTKSIVKGGTYAYYKGIPNLSKFASGLTIRASNILDNQNDDMLRATGMAGKTVVNAGRVGYGGVKTACKISIKTGKGVVVTSKSTWAAYSFVRQRGLAAGAKALGTKAGALAVKAGSSVASAILVSLRAVMAKLAIPLALIVLTVVAIIASVAGPMAAIGAVFGNTMSVTGDVTISYCPLWWQVHCNSYVTGIPCPTCVVICEDISEEYDIRDFLICVDYGIPALRNNMINYITELLYASHVNNGGENHIVRFWTPMSPDIIEHYDFASVYDAIISATELTDIIHPIFNAIVLKNYELEPTRSRARELVGELFEQIFIINEGQHWEWCGQPFDYYDADAMPDWCSFCGSIHAWGNCLNPIHVAHPSFTCSICCILYCPGHPIFDNCSDADCTDCPHLVGISVCPEPCRFRCNGILDCGGHRAMHVRVTLHGVFELKRMHFTYPIETLLNITDRTEEEQDLLDLLQDFYEVTIYLITHILQYFGGGMSMVDLAHINWYPSIRAGNQTIVNIALTQVGQQGGFPYWSWWGLSHRVHWCAIFSTWVFHHAGHDYMFPKGAGYNFAWVPNKEWRFRNVMNNWLTRDNWENPAMWGQIAPGDVMIFGWNGSFPANHVGIVVGVCADTGRIFNVEGNASDSVMLRAFYPWQVNQHIRGFGMMFS